MQKLIMNKFLWTIILAIALLGYSIMAVNYFSSGTYYSSETNLEREL